MNSALVTILELALTFISGMAVVLFQGNKKESNILKKQVEKLSNRFIKLREIVSNESISDKLRSHNMNKVLKDHEKRLRKIIKKVK